MNFNGDKGQNQSVIGDLRIPRAAWKSPAKNVEVKANLRKRSGSSVAETSSLIMDPSTREAMETGPTARSIELPRTTYTRGGTKLESEIYMHQK